jgi:hypothetical protein
VNNLHYITGGPRRQVVSWIVRVQDGVQGKETLLSGTSPNLDRTEVMDNNSGVDKTKAQSEHCSFA